MERLRGAGKVAAFVLLQVLVITGLLWGLNQLAAGADERAQQATEIAALQAGLDEANALLVEHGTPPVAVPEVEPGDAPTVVQIMPTQDQLDATVAAYCAANNDCAGRDGADGDSPAALTDAQLVGAVQACFAAGACPVPLDGIDGIDGKDGADGTNGTNGADAPPVTQDQINAAFAAYCDANNGCRGKDGADSTVPGPPGTTCSDGSPATRGQILMRTDDTSMPKWAPAEICVLPTEGN